MAEAVVRVLERLESGAESAGGSVSRYLKSIGETEPLFFCLERLADFTWLFFLAYFPHHMIIPHHICSAITFYTTVAYLFSSLAVTNHSQPEPDIAPPEESWMHQWAFLAEKTRSVLFCLSLYVDPWGQPEVSSNLLRYAPKILIHLAHILYLLNGLFMENPKTDVDGKELKLGEVNDEEVIAESLNSTSQGSLVLSDEKEETENMPCLVAEDSECTNEKSGVKQDQRSQSTAAEPEEYAEDHCDECSMEQLLADANLFYKRKLKKAKQRFELENLRQLVKDHLAERREWEKEKQDLFSQLCAATARYELYYKLHQSHEQTRTKWEEEKNDLISKLSYATASCEIYQELLHSA